MNVTVLAHNCTSIADPSRLCYELNEGVFNEHHGAHC